MSASLSKRLWRSQIPSKWRGAILTDYKITGGDGDPAALAAVAKWCEQEWKRGLLLIGAPGGGKSMLSCIAANNVLSKGGQPYFLPVQDLSNALYARVSMNDRDDQERFDWLLYFVTYVVDLLILDDMSSERASPTQYVEDRFKQIIRARGNAGKAMIITSNATPEQFTIRYGAPTTSYLQEVCLTVNVNAKDYRERHAND